MVSRKPSRKLLPHTITLWNYTGKSTVVNGVKTKQYQKTIIRYVSLDFRKITNVLQTGDTTADSLFLMIFNGVSVAMDKSGSLRNYVSSDIFLNTPEDKQPELWTLNDGDDFISIGQIEGDLFIDGLPAGGEKARKDYKIKIIDPKFGLGDSIHHWEVTGV